MKQVTEKQWLYNVAESKRLMSAQRMPQMQVAKMALEVCEISWGGASKKYKEMYTLTRFAKEVGIPMKTISNWCATYKQVYSKIPKRLSSQISYTEAVIIARKTNKTTTASEVELLIKDHLSLDRFSKKISRYLKALGSLSYNFTYKNAAMCTDLNVLQEVKLCCKNILTRIEEDAFEKVEAKDNGVAKENTGNISVARFVAENRNVRKVSRDPDTNHG